MNAVASHQAFSATATQLVRDFPEVRRMADHGPVQITSHGRTELVMLSPEHFAQMGDSDGGDAARLDWRLSIVLDTIDTNILILDDDLNITRANRALCEAINCDEVELLGRHVSIMVAHPSDRYLMDRLAEVHLSRMAEVMVVPSARNDGRILQLALKPWPNGVAIFCDDITERTRSRDIGVSVGATDYSLAALDGVGIIHAQSCGTILVASKGLARMTGAGAESLLGTRMQNLFPIQSRAIVNDALRETQEGTKRYAVEYLHNGVKPAPATLSLTPYWTAEHHACVSIALQDKDWHPA